MTESVKVKKIIGGVHPLTEALKRGFLRKIFLSSNKKSKNVKALIALAREKNIPIEEVERYQIDMLLPNMRHHQGIAGEYEAAQKKWESWQEVIEGKPAPFILVLDSIQDPHNLGACLRSAVAAGVDAVIMPNRGSADLTATVSKVASGAAEIIPIFKVANLTQEVEKMKTCGIWIVGGAGEAENTLYQLDLNRPLALIVGNEGEGIHLGLKKRCDFLARIPMSDNIESLNVSVACGVMLFEAQRQRQMVGENKHDK